MIIFLRSYSFLLLILVPLLSCITIIDVYAHPVLIDSSPKQFSTVEENPETVVVFFSEPIVLQYSKITVIDSEGNRVDEGMVQNFNEDTASIFTSLNKDTPHGTYTVNTKVLSAVDGHVVDDSFIFGIGKGQNIISTELDKKNIFDLLSIENSAGRIPGYVGQILLIGGIFIFFWMKRPLIQTNVIESIKPHIHNINKNLLKILIISASLVLVSTILVIVFQTLRISGSVLDILDTNFGMVVLIRLALSIITLLFLLSLYRVRIYSNDNKIKNSLIIVLILSLSILATNSLISHAATLKNYVPVFFDYFHGVAASLWIGGLIFLSFIFVPEIPNIKENRLRVKLNGIMIPRFSRLVLIVLGSISITGPTLLWFIESDIDTTIASLYGKILAIKFLLAGTMIIFGAYHQFISQKKIIKSINNHDINIELINTNDVEYTKKFGLTLKIEAVIGILLLLTVSLLANMVLPSGEIQSTKGLSDLYEIQDTGTEKRDSYRTILYADGHKIKVDLEPASLGENKLKLEFLTDTKPINTIDNVTIKMIQIEKGIGPIQIAAAKENEGIFMANIPFSVNGLWNIVIQGEISRKNIPNLISQFDINIKPRLKDLNFNITEYKIPDSLPLQPIYHKESNSIWVGDTKPGSGRLLEFNLENKSPTIHKINGTNLITLSTFDSIDNNILWFADPTTNILGKYNIKTQEVIKYPIPEKGIISGLTIDDKQNIWMSMTQANLILKYNSIENEFESYTIPTENSRPLAIIYDYKDKNIWFVESIGKIGKIDTETKEITEYPNNIENDKKILLEPTSLLWDSKNSLLFISDHQSNSIVSFNPLLSSFKNYILDNDNGLAFGMTFDNYHNIWIAQHVTDNLVVFDPESGQSSIVKIPTSGSFIQYLTTESNGDVWFAEQRGNALGNVKIIFEQSASVLDNQVNQSAATQNNLDKMIISFKYSDIFGPLIVIGIVVTTLLYIKNEKQMINMRKYLE